MAEEGSGGNGYGCLVIDMRFVHDGKALMSWGLMVYQYTPLQQMGSVATHESSRRCNSSSASTLLATA